MALRIAIALGAGLASAVLFVAFARGTPLAIVLAYVAPLPVMIAALGWRHQTGLGAALIAACAISLGVTPLLGLVLAVSLTLPAWGLAYLSLLAQPTANPQAFDWYPVGRIAAWAVGAACLLPLAQIVMLASRDGGYDASLTALTEPVASMIRQITGPGQLTEEAARQAASFVLRAMPAMAAGFSFLLLAGNLWLAGRIVATSGRLPRPWPSLPESLWLPRWVLGLLLGGLLLTAFGGVAGAVGSIAAASSATAIALQGLTSVHRNTRGWNLRGLFLTAVYVGLFLFQAMVVVFLLMGILDVLGLRRRGLPPALPPQSVS